MEPSQIPPFPQDGVSSDLTKQKTPAEADAARETLLEAIAMARKALDALPPAAGEAATAADEAPIAPPENLEISPPVSASKPETTKESKTEPTPVTATVEAPEERASRESDILHPDPVEIHYWRRAQIDAMNEDLAHAFEQERKSTSGETAPFEVAPLTFSHPPFPASDAEDDGATSQELPLGGTDGSQVVLPS